MSLQESGALVEVADTGIGMTLQEQTIALQPFGQIDSFQARKHKGTGLGLPLVNAMVELHGGSMTMRSTPGEGTIVAFNLPRERILGANPMPNLQPNPDATPVCNAGSVLAIAST